MELTSNKKEEHRVPGVPYIEYVNGVPYSFIDLDEPAQFCTLSHIDFDAYEKKLNLLKQKK